VFLADFKGTLNTTAAQYNKCYTTMHSNFFAFTFNSIHEVKLVPYFLVLHFHSTRTLFWRFQPLQDPKIQTTYYSRFKTVNGRE